MPTDLEYHSLACSIVLAFSAVGMLLCTFSKSNKGFRRRWLAEALFLARPDKPTYIGCPRNLQFAPSAGRSNSNRLWLSATCCLQSVPRLLHIEFERI